MTNIERLSVLTLPIAGDIYLVQWDTKLDTLQCLFLPLLFLRSHSKRFNLVFFNPKSVLMKKSMNKNIPAMTILSISLYFCIPTLTLFTEIFLFLLTIQWNLREYSCYF